MGEPSDEEMQAFRDELRRVTAGKGVYLWQPPLDYTGGIAYQNTDAAGGVYQVLEGDRVPSLDEAMCTRMVVSCEGLGWVVEDGLPFGAAMARLHVLFRNKPEPTRALILDRAMEEHHFLAIIQSMTERQNGVVEGSMPDGVLAWFLRLKRQEQTIGVDPSVESAGRRTDQTTQVPEFPGSGRVADVVDLNRVRQELKVPDGHIWGEGWIDMAGKSVHEGLGLVIETVSSQQPGGTPLRDLIETYQRGLLQDFADSLADNFTGTCAVDGAAVSLSSEDIIANMEAFAKLPRMPDVIVPAQGGGFLAYNRQPFLVHDTPIEVFTYEAPRAVRELADLVKARLPMPTGLLTKVSYITVDCAFDVDARPLSRRKQRRLAVRASIDATARRRLIPIALRGVDDV